MVVTISATVGPNEDVFDLILSKLSFGTFTVP